MPIRPAFRALGLGLVVSTLLASSGLAAMGCLGSDGTMPVPGGADAGGLALLAVSVASQDFGSVALGAASAPVTIAVVNSGGKVSGPITVSIGGSTPGEFTIDSDGCKGQILAPQAGCAIALHFAPKTAATASALLMVTGDPGGSALVQLAGKGLAAGTLALAPTTADFGPVAVGDKSAAKTFTLTSAGGATTGPLSVVIEGSDQGSFQLVNDKCSAKAIAPAGTCTVDVQFAPAGVGTKAASLTINGAPGGAATAALGGTALTGGALAIAPATQDFGNVVAGQTSDQTLTVTNTGGAATGALTTAFTGVDATQFAVKSTTCSGPLAAGASCTATVSFVPTSAGAKSATFGVGASPGGTAASSLTGTALAPAALTVTPLAQDYGSLVTGQTSTVSTFTVKNTGGVASGALAFSLTGTDKADFAIDGATTTCKTAALAGGAQCAIGVTFKPSKAAAEAAKLSVSATPAAPVDVALSGTGLTPGSLGIAPATFSFADTLLNAVTADQSFVVTNKGGGATGTLAASITGTGAGQFKLGTDGCTGTTLAGGGAATCTVKVHFAPTTSGAQSATLVLSATGAGGSVTATLGGNGLAPAKLAWAAGTYNCGTSATGSSTATPVVLDNSGDVAASVPAFVVTGTNAGDFTTAAGTCASGVPAHGSCTATVTFAPKTTAGESATLQATSATGGSASTSLTGTGAVPAGFTITPASHDFGSAVKGSTAGSQLFTIKNTGGVPAGGTTALALSATGANAADFALSGSTCGATLPGGGTCTVNVTFKPTTTAAEAASLRAAATPGGAQTAALTGTGLTAGALAIDNGTHPFGNQVVQTSSGDFVFTISNTGGGATSALAVSLVGGAGSSFAIGADGCSGGPLTGAGSGPSSQCTVAVHFSPATAGLKTDTLQITAATGGTVTATLNGTGITQATLGLTTAAGASTNFGAYVDGNASPAITFTVKNNGQAASGPIAFTIAGANGGDFGVASTTCPTSGTGLAGGASCTAGLVFKPSIVGGESASVTVSANPGGTSTPALGLVGTGYSTGSQLVLTPASQDYGVVLVSNGQVCKSFTVTNVGGTDVKTFGYNDMNQTMKGAYYVASPAAACFGGALAANGGACVFDYCVYYQNPGTAAETLTLFDANDNADTASSSLTATIAYTAAASLSIYPTQPDIFSGFCPGTSQTQTFYVTNNGAASTKPLSIAITNNTGADHYTVTNDTCSGKPQGNGVQCQFDLTYTAAQSCSHPTSTVTITDGNGATVSVNVDASMG